jgi:hypothetical protein
MRRPIMKKLISFFICIFLAAAFTLNAQDYAKKGVWELGGSISYSNNSLVIDGESDKLEIDGGSGVFLEVPSISTFIVNVPVSYFVIDGWQIGLVPEYLSISTGTKIDNLIDVDISTSAYGIFFSTAYNFNTGGSVYPFLGGMFGYNSATITIDLLADLSGIGLLKGNAIQQQQTEEVTASGIGWGFSGGIKIQVGKGALVNLGVGYQQRTLDPDPDEELGIPADLDRSGVNTILVSAGVSIFLGR